ncbi:MAG: type II secretion system F family protein [Thioalkalivibrionaceae bacterium]
MSDYRCRVVNASGREEVRVESAESPAELVERLAQRGEILLDLRESKRDGSRVRGPGLRTGRRKNPWKRDEKRVFLDGVATMLEAGVPAERAFHMVVGTVPDGSIKTIADELRREVKRGRAISTAIEARPEWFDGFDVAVVRAGEATGSIDSAFRRLTQEAEERAALEAEVRAALAYPIILVVVSILALGILLGFVVPQFRDLFDDAGDALPLLTQIVISVGDFTAQWAIWLVLGLSLALAALWPWWFSADGVRRRHGWWLRTPWIGDWVRGSDAARFLKTLGVLLDSGVNLAPAVKIAVGAPRNVVFREGLGGVSPRIKRGERFAQALDDFGAIPKVAVQMVRIGEETGRLPPMVLKASRYLEQRSRAALKRAVSLIEPVSILVLGAFISMIIMGILLGILSVNEMVG